MDENEIDCDELELTPRLHNRWSVLVLAASCAQQMSSVITDVLTGAVKMAVEHAAQKNYDREFNKIVEED